MNDGGGARRVRVPPEPVTNQLIVRARRDDLFTIEKLLQQLDVPIDNQPPRKR
jgi:type II secretory pathway component GspD/PulD (secretin)